LLSSRRSGSHRPVALVLPHRVAIKPVLLVSDSPRGQFWHFRQLVSSSGQFCQFGTPSAQFCSFRQLGTLRPSLPWFPPAPSVFYQFGHPAPIQAVLDSGLPGPFPGICAAPGQFWDFGLAGPFLGTCAPRAGLVNLRMPPKATLGLWRSQGQFLVGFALRRQLWGICAPKAVFGDFRLPGPFLGRWPPRAVLGNLALPGPFSGSFARQAVFWDLGLPGPFLGLWLPRPFLVDLRSQGSFWALRVPTGRWA
jgi:hypothetical protein